MKKYSTLCLCIIFLSGCELIEIGTKRAPLIEISQKSPIGTVFLFKAKLDSNKVNDASHLFLRPSGDNYLAVEKVELTEDLSRLSRIIGKKTITSYKADTLDENMCSVFMQIDYTRKMHFDTKKIKDDWYIVGYK
jgi:hypothetical protein